MEALRDGEAAMTVARRLRALAADIGQGPRCEGPTATLVDAFLGAAQALESSVNPPPRHQLLALVQVLTAGFELLSAEVLLAPGAANDFA